MPSSRHGRSITAARESVAANRELVSAAELALSGVIEERKVGQRTTLDVLDAQADVISAQVDLVSSERDVVVASYAILSAIGHLSAGRLGLNVAEYHPEEHYNAVKDKWFGLQDARRPLTAQLPTEAPRRQRAQAFAPDCARPGHRRSADRRRRCEIAALRNSHTAAGAAIPPR